MKILMIACEAVPFSKSGGLADVAGALPAALIEKGLDARIVTPAYNTKVQDAGEFVCEFDVPLLSCEEHVVVTRKTVGKTPYYFICHPMYCDRLGIYGDTSFTPYADNALRFSLYCKASLMLCEKISWKPDILHTHDWTAGLVPAFLKDIASPFFKDTKTVFTIHNLAYQGVFSRMSYLLTGSEPFESVFFNGQLNMMYAGVMMSDFITTVSPTYANEIQTKEQGCGLDDALIKRKDCLMGIVNGIDVNDWSPEQDKNLEHHFSVSDLSGKAKMKSFAQKEFGLPVASDVPLFAMISRLASQKGFDALLSCLEGLLRDMRLQFVIIGTGDSAIERALLDLDEKYDNLSVNIMFSNKAAHQVEAGADFFLMPSRYEPCGLNQLYSLRYGTLPIVRNTGGLADTVADIDKHPGTGTGIVFDELNGDNIYKSVERAVWLYDRPDFSGIVKRAMSQDFSWSASADKYIGIYESLVKGKQQ